MKKSRLLVAIVLVVILISILSLSACEEKIEPSSEYMKVYNYVLENGIIYPESDVCYYRYEINTDELTFRAYEDKHGKCIDIYIHRKGYLETYNLSILIRPGNQLYAQCYMLIVTESRKRYPYVLYKIVDNKVSSDTDNIEKIKQGNMFGNEDLFETFEGHVKNGSYRIIDYFDDFLYRKLNMTLEDLDITFIK